MTPLNPAEHDLVGKWVMENGRVVGDQTQQRIQYLVKQHLRSVATTGGGWEKLYLDPTDGRFWELTYPQGEFHGGGPSRLTWLSADQARQKYGGVAIDLWDRVSGPVGGP